MLDSHKAHYLSGIQTSLVESELKDAKLIRVFAEKNGPDLSDMFLFDSKFDPREEYPDDATVMLAVCSFESLDKYETKLVDPDPDTESEPSSESSTEPPSNSYDSKPSRSALEEMGIEGTNEKPMLSCWWFMSAISDECEQEWRIIRFT